MWRRTWLFVLFWGLFSSQVLAFTPQEERQIIRDLAEIKATLKVFMEQTNKRFEDINRRFEDINKRFEDINRRFEDINKRFEDINKRFEEINHRFEQLYTFLWIITGIFTSFTLGVIGLALWDRRTIVRRAREEALERILEVFKELAKEDERIARALRKQGLAL